MFTTLVAATAILASPALASIGSAIVLNKCEYPVYYNNTPAADGGADEIGGVLKYNDTYEQGWTSLTNGDGWSIKLSKSTSLETIMQYEYTCHDDGTIWYDLSDVNGNPWDGDWEITATSESGVCTPKQAAYRYATDDAYGMQACPDDSIITVTLCSGESQDDGSAASASSSAAAVTSSLESATSAYSTLAATPTVYTEAASTTEALSTSETPTSTVVATTPTTFATLTTSTGADANGATVTEVATAIVTDVVTQTYYQEGHHWHTARHEHHARHAHRRN